MDPPRRRKRDPVSNRYCSFAEGVDYGALRSKIDELIDSSRYAKLPTPETSSVVVAQNFNSGSQEHIELVYDGRVFDQSYESLD